MSNIPSNIHPDYISKVSQDVLALEFAVAVEGMFLITGYARVIKRGGRYVTLFCKPTRTISDSLLLNREVLVIITKYDNLDPRTISVIKDIIKDRSPQLATEVAIVIHSESGGDSKLRQWGKEQAIKIVPIFRPKGSAHSAEITLRQQLSASLLSVDPFQVTGPVSDDLDFFGRKNDALDILRQLESGRIRAIFGMRKIGKTSFINRIIALAREKGTMRVAMIDCSLKDFNKLNAQEALRVLARVSKFAANRGYAHVSEALQRSEDGLIPVFSDLWLKEKIAPLVIVFDEVDYITPGSPSSPHWSEHFNEFWREFRVLVQEAQRHGVLISILVSGVSSKYFREESINGIENSALYFIPDEYLPPFSRKGSQAMIVELSRRCGLRFSTESSDKIASVCADLPFWIRMAGSYIHRSIDSDLRPQSVAIDATNQLLDNFIKSDGAELARVALQHLRNVYPEVVSLLHNCIEAGRMPVSQSRLLIRYGLASQVGDNAVVTSDLLIAGLRELQTITPALTKGMDTTTQQSLNLSADEWGEELAVINRRRNNLERAMRQLVRFTLKVETKAGVNWTTLVLQSLPTNRREVLNSLSASALMDSLFWLELDNIITKNWTYFEKIFGDQARFKSVMQLINDRPDSHAKNIDLADVALYRRELNWLEGRVDS
jgi:hypothetical protein